MQLVDMKYQDKNKKSKHWKWDCILIWENDHSSIIFFSKLSELLEFVLDSVRKG